MLRLILASTQVAVAAVEDVKSQETTFADPHRGICKAWRWGAINQMFGNVVLRKGRSSKAEKKQYSHTAGLE